MQLSRDVRGALGSISGARKQLNKTKTRANKRGRTGKNCWRAGPWAIAVVSGVQVGKPERERVVDSLRSAPGLASNPLKRQHHP